MHLPFAQAFHLLIFATLAAASHVGYFPNPGPSGYYTVRVGVTLAIPAAFNLIPNPNIPDLAAVVLGDVYRIAADYWMFPPTASDFTFASTAAQKYATVGANLDFNGAELDDIKDICAAIAKMFAIKNVGNIRNISKRREEDFRGAIDTEKDVLLPRGGQCPVYNTFKPYVTGDHLQSQNGHGGCAV